MPVKNIRLNSVAYRLTITGAALACLLGAVFAAKWFFGSSIASRAAYIEVAEFAADLSPADPQAYYTQALLAEKNFSPDSMRKSLAEYETAAALAPYDYRLWLAVGKAREQNGDAAGAETALRKALELAPNYASVQWMLGNVLLRVGKTSEAFEQLRRASEGDAKYAAPAVYTAWQIFDGDMKRIQSSLGDSNRTNFALADFLVREKKFDEAFEIWNALPADAQNEEYKAAGNQLLSEMLAAKKFDEALIIQNRLNAAGDTKFVREKVSNGGFEQEIAVKNASVFDWQIGDALQPQIGVDEREKHGGSRSLVIIFKSADGKDFRQLTQTVAVEPGAQYRFQTFYKSELKAPATVKWEIVSAADGSVLASTEAAANNADWTALTADFQTSEATAAVTLRLARAGCKSSFCPISGKIWFDDFSITR